MSKKEAVNLPVFKTQEEKINYLLEQNLVLTQEVQKLTKKINWYLWASQVKTLLWLLVIIGSIVASVVYLPPLLKGALSSYTGTLPGL